MTPKQRLFFLSLDADTKVALAKKQPNERYEALNALMAMEDGAENLSPATEPDEKPEPEKKKKKKEKKPRKMRVTGHYNPLELVLPFGNQGRDVMPPFFKRPSDEELKEMRKKEKKLPSMRGNHKILEIIEPQPRYNQPISDHTRALLGALRLAEKQGANGDISRQRFLRRARNISKQLERELDKGVPQPSYVAQSYSEEYVDGFWDHSTEGSPWWERYYEENVARYITPLEKMTDYQLKGIAFPNENVEHEEKWRRMLEARRIFFTRKLLGARKRWQSAVKALASKWNVNEVTKEQLVTIPRIGEKLASYIIECREKAYGEFRSKEEFPSRLQWLFEDYLYIDHHSDRWYILLVEERDRTRKEAEEKWDELSNLVDWKNNGFEPLIWHREPHIEPKLDLAEIQMQQMLEDDLQKKIKEDRAEERELARQEAEVRLQVALRELQKVYKPFSGKGGPDHTSRLASLGLFCNLSSNRFGKVVAQKKEGKKK